MSPILGTVASQFSSKPFSSFESIATVTVSSAVSTVSFTSIPATYTHLQVRVIARSTGGSGGTTQATMKVNGITSGYSYHVLVGTGSSAVSEGGAATGSFYAPAPRFANNGAAAGIFGGGIIDILDYANTNKYKTGRCLSGVDLNGSGQIILSSAILGSTTSAISSLEFQDQSGDNFAQYSSFALYGIKGA
jgi:hypothetical protein